MYLTHVNTADPRGFKCIVVLQRYESILGMGKARCLENELLSMHSLVLSLGYSHVVDLGAGDFLPNNTRRPPDSSSLLSLL